MDHLHKLYVPGILIRWCPSHSEVGLLESVNMRDSVSVIITFDRFQKIWRIKYAHFGCRPGNSRLQNETF